jgi:hypothetical protein
MKGMKAYFPLLLVPWLLISCVEQQPLSDRQIKHPIRQVNCEGSEAAEALADPKNIAELVELINALPKPLDLACLLKSLKRPLYVNATSSTLSAQPAFGENNPRIFIFKGNLIISVVPDGPGSKLLEMSELKYSRRSIKGELKLPISEQLSYSGPFQDIITTQKTSCSGCHSLEQAEYELEGVQVYSSLAIKPTAKQFVHLDDLKFELYNCQLLRDRSSRCRVLDALLNHGDVLPQNFPADMPTFLESIRLGLE